MNRIPLPWLNSDPSSPFPDPERALREPNGLLCAGGDLSVPRLLAAYRRGIFPWYMPREPVLWWSPDPRCVFDAGTMHVPRRLARWLRGCRWTLRADVDFAAVLDACAAPRTYADDTWITPEMRAAYLDLHRAGHAHSVEVFDGRERVGGLYGVVIGAAFFAESMFSARDNGSKVALLGLARAMAACGMPLLDAQVASPHLFTLGALTLPRRSFLAAVATLTDRPTPDWQARLQALSPADLAPRSSPP